MSEKKKKLLIAYFTVFAIIFIIFAYFYIILYFIEILIPFYIAFLVFTNLI